MRRFFALFILNLLLCLLQTAFFPELFGVTAAPNLVLAFSFALFFLHKFNLSFLSCFIGGLLLDLLVTLPVGLSSVILLSCLVCAFYVRRYLFRGLWFYPIVVVITAYLYLYSVGFLEAGFFVFDVWSGINTLLSTFIFYIVTKKVFNETNSF